jgi:hypothetical protein
MHTWPFYRSAKNMNPRPQDKILNPNPNPKEYI